MAKTGIGNLSPDRVRELARTGAQVTINRLRAEIAAIERAFPELATRQGRQAVGQSVTRAARRTRTMSAAARKVVSARMKRYWAERRKAQTTVKK